MTGGQMSTIKVELFGKDPKVQKALSTAKNVSVTKAPVLIVGERGVGKRSLAKFIHDHSGRSHKPFFAIDCAGDPVEVENQILGHRDEESGRFNKGVLELGDKGTVVFANIDAMEEGFQKRLFQVLSELKDYEIDIRIMATTTKNLSKLVGAGRFYRGLYTLVSSNALFIPPLRERINDIEYIAHFLINETLKENKDNVTLTQSAINKMVSHYWTHNVFELVSVMESTLEEVLEGDITDDNLCIGDKKMMPSLSDDENEGIRLMSLKEAEKMLIKKALIHTSENRTQAAKILGVSIRTLRNKINEYRQDGSSFFVNLR
jgi:two-component system, response regulator FlrC